MLKINIGESYVVEHKGDPVRVAAEVACSIGAIFNGFKTTDTMSAEMFRLALVKMLLPDSGVWNPGDGDVISIVLPSDKKKGGA